MTKLGQCAGLVESACNAAPACRFLQAGDTRASVATCVTKGEIYSSTSTKTDLNIQKKNVK